MKMKNALFINASLILLLLAACSALKPAPAPTQTPEAMPKTGVQYHFITNALLIPTTKAQTEAVALNIDGDAQQHPDNLFGELLTLLTTSAQGVEMQSALDQAVKTGQLVSLHVVKADDPLNDTSVSWSIFQGQKTQSPPAFDGTDKFTLDSAAPTNSPIVGSITNGHFSGGSGTAQVQLYVLGQPVDVSLIGVRLEADVSAKGCVNGKLGGGITVAEFRGKLLPAIADGLNRIIKSDKTVATTILQSFDSDKNGAISVQELESNPLLMLAVSPDLDLLDATGKFSPSQDGVKDSFSVGLGFTCVPATFTAPGDVVSIP